MCFLKTIQKNTLHLEARVATRPIRVIKIGLFDPIIGAFVSEIMSHIYEVDTLNYIKRIPEPYVPYVIDTDKQNIYLEYGYHSYKQLPDRYITLLQIKETQRTIGIFEIPTGSIYYYDGNEEVVSDAIVLRKLIYDLNQWKEENFQPENILL